MKFLMCVLPFRLLYESYDIIILILMVFFLSFMMRQVYTECANIKISLLCIQYRCEVGAGGWLLTGSLHADGGVCSCVSRIYL